MPTRAKPVVALFPWSLLLEDFLEPNGLTLADFCGSFTGSWMFGYADALRRAGVETVIFPVTAQVETVTRVEHGATGTPISLLPTTRAYRALRGRMLHPYGRTTRDVFPVSAAARAATPALFALKELAPYLATPLAPFLDELRARACGAILCQEYEFPRFDFCVATRRLHRLPVFGVFQGGDYRRWRVERLVRRRAVSGSAGLIVASERERERVARVYPGARVSSIPNPIDLSVWRPRDRATARAALGIRDDELVVAWHGRVDVWKKGLDTLVDAWGALSAKRPSGLRLLLIGTGADADAVGARIRAHELTNVLWIDRYVHGGAEIAELLAAADGYVFPSRHEGFPVAPLEAMACGLPVVAADVSGIRDVIRDEETSGCVLVPAGDPAALAHELGRLALDADARARRSLRARSRAEAYGLDAIGKELRSLVLDGPGAGRRT